MIRRRLVTTAALLPLAGVAPVTDQALAQAPVTARRVSVLSELGREILVVTYQESIGTNLDANRQQRMPVPGGAYDKAALVLAKSEIVSREPQAVVKTFVPLEADVFSARQSFATGSDSGLPADLKAALQAQGSTQLLLLSRFSTDASFQMRNAKIGSGRLEGLGFYIDNATEVDRTASGVNGRGFLGPFAYVRATLIDASSGRVIKSRVALRTNVVPASASTEGSSTHPWDALDDRRKTRVISDLLADALAELVPEVLAGG